MGLEVGLAGGVRGFEAGRGEPRPYKLSSKNCYRGLNLKSGGEPPHSI